MELTQQDSLQEGPRRVELVCSHRGSRRVPAPPNSALGKAEPELFKPDGRFLTSRPQSTAAQ